jgi:chitin synthase
MILCLKELNQRKVNSHRWVFSALCQVLKPSVCVLLEGGSIPSQTAIYELWRAIDFDDEVGCAISKSNVFIPSQAQRMSPIVGFQKFEFQLSNMLQRPFETLTKHRTGGTRGALTAYRFSALSDRSNDGPLDDYYAIEKANTGPGEASMSIFTANKYLVEERVLWACSPHVLGHGKQS